MESSDLIENNIDKLASLFPEVITESLSYSGVIKKNIDFEKLKIILGSNVIEENDEIYEFTWPGKKLALSEAYKPTRSTLRPDKEESVNWDSTENLYIEGDNLEVIKILQESYLGKIKIIYIDPPYNTGSDFVYPDDFYMDDDRFKSESGYFDNEGNVNFSRENTPSAARYHSDWCSMIYPRLILARNLLSDDGVIFISIDDTELENLKKICEEVFGKSNFIANIIWKHTQQSKNDERFFSRQYNHTLVYARDKSKLNHFYFERTDEDNLNYKNPDNDPKGLWRSGDVRSPSYRKSLCYEIKSPNGQVIQPPKNGWRWSEDQVKKKIATGEIKFKPDGSGIIRKIYLCDQPGRTPENLWEGKKFGTTRQAASLIKKMFNGVQIFDTPKPHELIMCMLQIIQDKNALVLDFFSGSATTAHAVIEQNIIDGGSRKFIMVQLPEPCPIKSLAYENGFKTISDIGKERIRRVPNLLSETYPDLTNWGDVGFRVLKLDSSNMKDVYYSPKNYEQNYLFMSESNIKEDRTDLDLLFSCLLEWGLEITKKYESENVLGVTIHTYDNNPKFGASLIACFANDIPEEAIKEIARRQPLRAVFRDSSFRDDAARVNLGEIFKLLSPDTEVKVL